MVQEFPGAKLRIFAVWEPVLATDVSAPSTQTLKRLHDPRAAQFYDPARLLSKIMGEHDKKSIVWDYIAIYKPGQRWEQPAPPEPSFSGRTIVRVIDKVRQAFVAMWRTHSAIMSPCASPFSPLLLSSPL